jgi:ABC-2 type transport system permease protein
MSSLLRQLWLFFWRDLSIARTYRALFVMEIVEALFGTALFYYVSRFVDSPQLESSLPQGHTYFAFALVGFVFFDYLSTALDAFDRSLTEARDSGTLEQLLVTQTSLPVLLAGSAVYPFVTTTLRIAVYFAWGALLFGFPVAAANWLAVLAVLLASLLAFCGFGIFSSSYLLLFKRGNPAKWLLLGLSSLVGGMLFPVTILPDWLQWLARLNPITYSLDAMRDALLAGASVQVLWRPLALLLLFAIVLLPSSMLAFAWALRRTKVIGTLTHR